MHGTCLLDINICNCVIFFSLCAVPLPALSANISFTGSLEAGKKYNLICVVSELISGLTEMPNVKWARAADDILPETIYLDRTDRMATAVLNFNPVKTSFSG